MPCGSGAVNGSSLLSSFLLRVASGRPGHGGSLGDRNAPASLRQRPLAAGFRAEVQWAPRLLQQRAVAPRARGAAPKLFVQGPRRRPPGGLPRFWNRRRTSSNSHSGNQIARRSASHCLPRIPDGFRACSGSRFGIQRGRRSASDYRPKNKVVLRRAPLPDFGSKTRAGGAPFAPRGTGPEDRYHHQR